MTKQHFMDVTAALELGEGQFIEFKESPDKSLSKEMVAFANNVTDGRKNQIIKLIQENNQFNMLTI